MTEPQDFREDRLMGDCTNHMSAACSIGFVQVGGFEEVLTVGLASSMLR